MPRRHSAGRRSDASEVDDMEGLAESELAKLQRQYRIMEGDRQAYSVESQDLIRRQRAEIDKLQAEQNELFKDLKLSRSKFNKVKDEENKDVLKNLVAAKDEYGSAIEAEKERIAELDIEIRKWERKVDGQRKSMGGSNIGREHEVKVRKQMRVLENRLDRSTKGFNEALTRNAKLREEIDSLRTERARFEQLFKKLDKELKDTRKEIGETIESSTAAYDSRDEAQAKMILLKEKADKDLAQHTQETKELQRVIDHDRKLKEFMGIKTMEREEDEQARAQRIKREMEEAERKKKEAKEESVETYEEAFMKIREVTGEEDLDLLVEKFIETEDRNFALFNYVNEQNNELEKLHDEIEEIQEEIKRFQQQGVSIEQQRQLILKDLEEQSETAGKTANEHDERSKAINKILDQLKAGINSLFDKLSCDRTALQDMLGGTEGVRNDNMMQYLGVIEERTNELLASQAYLMSKDYERPYDPKLNSLLGEGPTKPPPPLQIEPPTTGDDYDSDDSAQPSDEDQRPLTQSELKNRVMKGVIKKEKAAGQKKTFTYDLSGAKDLKQSKSYEKKKGKH
ncbi:coiled-coil domain-containing protein 63-like [Branchiostoma floridae x Branchiostoma belcheri]